MTVGERGRTVLGMTKRICISDSLVVVLLTAVVSLASAQLVALGTEALGSGPVSTFAVVGNVAGLVACAGSAWLGFRRLHG
jgi:hypothetical protein